MKTLVPALAVLCSACATMPITGAVATGEPLSVRTEQRFHTYTEKVKVGEVQHQDEHGNNIGRSEVYENRTGVSTSTEWVTTQGPSRIDEYDFFHIAGDEAAARQVLEYRETGLTMNRTGWGLIGGGLAAMLGGGMMAANADVRVVGGSVSLVGVLTGLVGYFVMQAGATRLHPDAHMHDAGQAQVAASRYNAELAQRVLPPPSDALIPSVTAPPLPPVQRRAAKR